MGVYKSASRNRWRYDFEYRARRYSGYCNNVDGTPATSKAQAKSAERRARTSVEIAPELPPIAFGGDPVLAEAMAVYADHLSKGAHGMNQRAYVRELLEWFGPEYPIKELESRVQGYIHWARSRPIRIYAAGRTPPNGIQKEAWRSGSRTRSDATINRYLDALRKAVRLFGEQRDPVTGRPRLEWLPRIPELKEPERAPRPISDEDILKIVKTARSRWPWVADALLLASHMGFRRSEMLDITLDRVDLEMKGVWLRPEDTKANRGEFIMANEVAYKVLKRRTKEAQELGIPWLFWHQRKRKDGTPGKPMRVQNIKRSWRSALRAAGIETHHRFHDSKASFVTRIAMHANTSVKAIKELARHKNIETTLRYLEVADPEKRRAVEAIVGPATKSPTQKSHTPVRRGASKSG